MEYATVFELPEGCWINDYYLYVGDIKESGILAEKKSAMWIFSQIRNENRDPGILYYLTGKKIGFKVFPFQQYETRKTGIEFLHKDPVTLNIGDSIIELGDINVSSNQILETENMVYIPGTQKMILKPVTRKPYFHFLIDISTGKDERIEDYTKYIEHISEKYKVLSENARVSFVNSYTNTIPLNEDWQQKYQIQTFDGGFYTVLAYNLPDNTTTYLPDNNKPSIILKKDNITIYEPGIKEKNWLSALTMEGKWRSQILHPETLSDAEWLNMVKHSFKSRIMTPFTSYLVVENEAQKAVLKRKQEQVLSGNKSLDPGEDRRRMSEPDILFLILILGFILWYKEKRKRQVKQKND